MTIVDRFSGWAPKILAGLRILAGVMFACLGAQKVLGWFGGIPSGGSTWMVWVSGTIELVCGVLIAVGLFTRSAAFLSSGLMAFAYFIGHAGNGFWPTLNGGQTAILYCWIYLYIAAQGPGAFALDNVLWRRNRGAL